MRILYLAHRIPYPPNKGDKIRSFNEIKYLSKNNDIYLLCLVDDYVDEQYIDKLKIYCASIKAVRINKRVAKIKSLLALIGNNPLSLHYFYSKKLKKYVEEYFDKNIFDVIIVFSSSMAQYVIDTEGIPKIMDFVDADSDKWLQYAKYVRFPLSRVYKIESERLSRYEKEIIVKFQSNIVVTKKDAKLLNKKCNYDKTIVIENGVDLDFFSCRLNNYQSKIIIFIGAMDYFANIDGVLYFYEKIFPLVKERIPDVKFYIVGKNPSKEVLRLNYDPCVNVTGFVNDIRHSLSKSAVSVAPLRIARGVQNKILESFAIGIPVVSTPQAFEGINAEPQKDLFVESRPEEFASRVVEIIMDEDLKKRLSNAGKALVKARYNWEVHMKKLEDLIAEHTIFRQ